MIDGVAKEDVLGIMLVSSRALRAAADKARDEREGGIILRDADLGSTSRTGALVADCAGSGFGFGSPRTPMSSRNTQAEGRAAYFRRNGGYIVNSGEMLREILLVYERITVLASLESWMYDSDMLDMRRVSTCCHIVVLTVPPRNQE